MTAATAAPLRPRRSGLGERRWPLARIFTVAASLAAVIALAAVVLGAAGLLRLSDARSALLDDIAPMNLATKDLSLSMLDQETGVRGFVLSGRAESREPYDRGTANQRTAESSVRALAAQGGFADVVADLDVLDAAAARWRSTFAEPALAGRPPADLPPDGGKELFDGVRAALKSLQDGLDVLRGIGRDRLNGAVDNLTWIGAAIAVVLAGYLLAAAVGLRRSVLRPVSDLAEQVRGVVDGEVTREVRADGPREIVELGDDVEAMRVRILGDLDAAQEINHRLDEQARNLERSNRDLEQFAYVASHDLQEPLRKVASFCQLLQRRYGGQLDERADQYIAFAVDGAARMQQLINDLLAFSRVGRNTAGFTPVALDAVVAAAVAQLDQARKDVDGTVDVGPLPVVPGDAALLRQLFTNLVGNALKFHRDGAAPHVRITAAAAGDEWEITVADNGIGIEREYAEKVFVIFQRLHARDVYEGTGIGLALAKKIVEFHDGRIDIDAPAAEPGTTFRLTLPAAGDDKENSDRT